MSILCYEFLMSLYFLSVYPTPLPIIAQTLLSHVCIIDIQLRKEEKPNK